MATKKEDDTREETIRIDGPMTVYEVADLRECLLQSMDNKGIVHIDLQGVTDCDASGIQLLFSAFRTVQEKGLNISFTNIPEAIRDSADQLGLEIAHCANIQGG